MPVPTNKERKIIEKRTTQPLKELEKIKIYADEYLTKEIPKEELKYLNVELSLMKNSNAPWKVAKNKEKN